MAEGDTAVGTVPEASPVRSRVGGVSIRSNPLALSYSRHSFTNREFLRFVTSQESLTAATAIIVELQPKLNNNYIPTAHTCFSTLILPETPYESREVLEMRLLKCCEHRFGFGAK